MGTRVVLYELEAHEETYPPPLRGLLESSTTLEVSPMFDAITQLWLMLLTLCKAGTSICNSVLNVAEAGEVTSAHFKDNILSTLDLVEEPLPPTKPKPKSAIK